MDRIAGLRWCVMSLGMLIAASAQAQTAVGRTDGEASVAATGSARYSIPLSLPPGTNGLAPALAITYDSRSGNGLLGVGFRLAGLSRIHRCARTFAQDGAVGAVALDVSDRFCLDGQRLRLTAGTYGYAGSQYQTEVETFVRVTAIGTAGGGPASFRAEGRDGRIYEYGMTADARVEGTLSATPREWALNRIRDRDGNYLDVFYTEDAANGSHRPSAIQYTGNLQTGAVPYYSVFFTYESRPPLDVPYALHAGGVVSDLQRLDRIDVYHGPTGRTVRSFDLTYDASATTGRGRRPSRSCGSALPFRRPGARAEDGRPSPPAWAAALCGTDASCRWPWECTHASPAAADRSCPSATDGSPPGSPRPHLRIVPPPRCARRRRRENPAPRGRQHILTVHAVVQGIEPKSRLVFRVTV